MKQAVIYTRVSSRDQVENYSLSSQLSACTAYCEKNGFGIARVFVEEGESAKSADRTELQNLLGYCRENRGRVQALVVYNLSRFARDRFDHHALLAHLRRLGIVLRSVSEPVDETPSGELMDGVLAAIHQFENRIRADRTVSGMKEALREGRWVWKAPIGYHHPQGQTGPMVLDEERAPLVRWAFEQVATGRTTLEEVRRQVNEKGLRTKAGHPVPAQTFHRMLRSPLYVARIEHAKWGIEAKGAFPVLVPERRGRGCRGCWTASRPSCRSLPAARWTTPTSPSAGSSAAAAVIGH
jgi:site-specific DNA recombinase